MKSKSAKVIGCRTEKAGNTQLQWRIRQLEEEAASEFLTSNVKHFLPDGYEIWVMHKRNPYIRAYSAYLDKHRYVKQWIDQDRNKTFVHFLESLYVFNFFSDPHFLPNVEICHPDIIRYDFILDVEDLDNQEKCLWPFLFPQLSHIFGQPPVHKYVFQNSSFALLRDNILQPDVITLINLLYRRDFLFFRYPLLDTNTPLEHQILDFRSAK